MCNLPRQRVATLLVVDLGIGPCEGAAQRSPAGHEEAHNGQPGVAGAGLVDLDAIVHLAVRLPPVPDHERYLVPARRESARQQFQLALCAAAVTRNRPTRDEVVCVWCYDADLHEHLLRGHG